MTKHLSWAMGGAVSFWLPIILVFAVERTNANMLIANLAAVVGFLACWVILRLFKYEGRRSIWILLGLYFFGPILLSTATTFTNGGFTQIHGWVDIRWLLLACVFPPIQFLLAATSGLGPSLLIVTVILMWLSASEWRTSRHLKG